MAGRGRILLNTLQPPSAEHLLGTDDLGRDLLARLVLAIRASLIVGCGAVLLALTAGTVAGLSAGYGRGLLAGLVMRFSDVLLAFPPVLLAMVVATVMRAGFAGVTLAIAAVSIPTFARLGYALMLEQRGRQYVDAAVAFGASKRYVIFRSVLPNVLTPLVVQAAFTIANAMLLEAGLSFLGLGIQPPNPSLGLMLQEARGYLRIDPWLGICPGLVLIILVLALNGAADTIGRRLDPRFARTRLRQIA